MATLGELLRAADATSPLRLAAPWDNVGLLIGSRTAGVSRVLLTIDLTEAVLDEAARRARTAVVAYHPPVFDPIKRLDDADPRGALLLRAARELAGVIAPHTALDGVAGGVCDWLAEGVGEGLLAPIEPASGLPSGEALLVVTKLPADAAARVRDALALAGAGRIGAYARCSFEVEGNGTFEGDASTSPRVGRRGRFERVPEVKLEMVSSRAALAGVLAALHASHPYEEPPIEIHALDARPSVREGQGRMLELVRPASTLEVVARLARHLRLAARSFEVVESTSRGAAARGARARSRTRGAARGTHDSHRVVGLCPGSGASLLPRAIELGATLFVTGEMKHHERLDAAARGCTVILAGHTETERGFLPRYRTMLVRALPRVPITIAHSDRPPAQRV